MIPDGPAFSDLFRTALFKCLLFKAKAIANMGTSEAPAGASLGLAATEHLFSKLTPEQEVIPSPKLFFDIMQRQWIQLGSNSPPNNTDKKLYGLGQE